MGLFRDCKEQAPKPAGTQSPRGALCTRSFVRNRSIDGAAFCASIPLLALALKVATAAEPLSLPPLPASTTILPTGHARAHEPTLHSVPCGQRALRVSVAANAAERTSERHAIVTSPEDSAYLNSIASADRDAAQLATGIAALFRKVANAVMAVANAATI